MYKILSKFICINVLVLQAAYSYADYSPTWHKLTGDKNQPQSVYSLRVNSSLDSILLIDNKAQLWGYDSKLWKQITKESTNPNFYAHDVNIDNFEKLDFLALTDKNNQLWKYDGKDWQKLTGEPNAPKSVFYLYGTPNPSTILASDDKRNLWLYDGSKWQKMTNPKSTSQPSSFDVAFGDTTKNAIIIRTHTHNRQLWTYNGKTWQQLTGKANQPSSFVYPYGKPTLSSIVMKDENSILWTYDGSNWQQVTGKPSQPKWVEADVGHPTTDNPYGNPTPTSITLADASNNLWQFNGKIWKQISGNLKDTNQPHSIMGVDDTYFGPYLNVDSNNVVLEDQANDLWAYNEQAWQKLTGKSNQPLHVKHLYLNATPDAIVMFDQNDNIWTYKNKTWQQITGKPGQPSGIFHHVDGSLNGLDVQTPDAIAMVDDKWGLWIYNGKAWHQITGSINQPKSLKNTAWGDETNSMGILKQESTKFIAIKDESGNLWIWN